MITACSTVDRVFAPFEAAGLDVPGQTIGRPVSDLLGGAVRDRVPSSTAAGRDRRPWKAEDVSG